MRWWHGRWNAASWGTACGGRVACWRGGEQQEDAGDGEQDAHEEAEATEAVGVGQLQAVAFHFPQVEVVSR